MNDNERAYENFWTVRRYARARAVGLRADERAIFDLHAHELKRARLLDIGVGAGRTTGPLLERVREYVGIDIAVGMVRECSRVFPRTPLFVQDARDLSRFRAAEFDAVCFSFNGIDYVEHDDRLRILSEVRRVLRPGGLFVFSTHNRDWEHARQLRLPNLLTLNPAKGAVRAYRTARALLNRRRMKPREVETDEFAMINDDEQLYALLTYYISIPQMTKQLERAGFGSVSAWDGNGRVVTSDTRWPWIAYSARPVPAARAVAVHAPEALVAAPA
jgi:SAM-dependent methyltransferase